MYVSLLNSIFAISQYWAAKITNPEHFNLPEYPYISKLKLVHFKNHRSGDYEFDPNCNAISGANGCGKTNLLDAIYYLASGKSYYSNNDKANIQQGLNQARITGILEQSDFKTTIQVDFDVNQGKTLFTDGVKVKKLSEYIGQLGIVMIAPDDTDIVKGQSTDRRTAMDRVISQYHIPYLKALISAQRITEQRNRALKQMGEAGQFNDTLLDVFDQQLIPFSETIFEVRRSFMKGVEKIFHEIYAQISGESDHIFLEYRSELEDGNFADILMKNRPKDKLLGRTMGGVHKDDWGIWLHGNQELKKYGSQGQIKSFVIALKLSFLRWLEKEKGQTPVLLLDDLFEKIDQQRLKGIVVWLSKHFNGQWFVTDAHEQRLESLLFEAGVPKKSINIDRLLS